MKRRFYLLLLFSLTILASCDVVEGPYGTKYTGDGGGGGTDEAVSRVLLEDFTGHKCGNCPRATEKIDDLQNLYGDRVVAIGVHVGFFATPSGAGLFTADYRTQTGNELDQFYGNSVAGLPNGLINRISDNGNAIIDVNAWPSRVVNVLSQDPKLQLKLNATFSNATRLATANLELKALVDLNSQLKVVYYLTEDSILGSQKDYSLSPSDIPVYYHRHMLRGSMNGTWGENFASTSFQAGTTWQNTSSFTTPETWNQNKVAVVAIVFRADNREVVEVIEKKLTIQ